MQVSEAMTNDVKIASPNQSIRDAARLMAQIDAGDRFGGAFSGAPTASPRTRCRS